MVTTRYRGPSFEKTSSVFYCRCYASPFRGNYTWARFTSQIAQGDEEEKSFICKTSIVVVVDGGCGSGSSDGEGGGG